ncbi:uncharacterized protein LOC132310371 [Cornus florida]|uniref:uncharacterized protein LOC132310371 n=1 Tax=Cornus florida TaxID=4283 RepID=UPI0028A16F67|nr:uncharacterized protein LOC132310371 [Cornus florida]
MKRSKSFRCFRPVVIDDDDGSVLNSNRKDVPGDLVFTCLPTTDGDEGHNNNTTMVIPKLPDDNVDLSIRCLNEKSSCRSFSRVLKAVLFETSLAKKIRQRSAGRENPRSTTNSSTKTNKIAISLKERNLHRDQSSEGHVNCKIDPNNSSSGHSSSSSISLCCSCSSSIPSNPRSSSERKRSFGANPNPSESKQVQHVQATYCTLNIPKKKIEGCYGSETGLCLLLICLLVLVFWGKVCAIFCTSTLLYFAPARSQRVDSPERRVDLPDVDSKKYKKRVVMEGLLERNRL